MAIAAGQPAPDFTLPSTKGDPLTLSSLKGKKVVLAFFPAAFTGG
jgi:peroxiredoxin Q/BCP